MVEGEVQRSPENVVHLIASRVHDFTHLLDRLGDAAPPLPPLPADVFAHPVHARIRETSAFCRNRAIFTDVNRLSGRRISCAAVVARPPSAGPPGVAAWRLHPLPWPASSFSW